MAFYGFSLISTRGDFLREENFDTGIHSRGHPDSMVGIRTDYPLTSNTDDTHLGIRIVTGIPALQEGVKDRGTLLERRTPE